MVVSPYLFRLERARNFDFTYRGARPDTLLADSVVPRRLPVNTEQLMTLSVLGAPADADVPEHAR